ncbi:MAG: hypothetical protein GY841_20085 [FCB group bacterium]|nr:hypothetical protein [FCB group bacterium]
MEFSNDMITARFNAAFKGLTDVAQLGATILEPQQFKKYVEMLQIDTVILQRARQMIMDSHTVDIDRIAFNDHVLGAPAAEGAEIAQEDFAAPDFAQHQLIAFEVQGVVGITDKMLRRNPERKRLTSTILRLMSKRTGVDMEYLGIQGDTDSSIELLAQGDGWLKQTRKRVVEDAAKLYDDDAVASFATGAGETEATVFYDNVPVTRSTFEIYTTSTSDDLVAHDDGEGEIVEDNASGIEGYIDYLAGGIDLTGLTASTSYYVKYTAKSFDIDAASGTLWPENMFDVMLESIPDETFKNPEKWYINVPRHVMKAYRNILKSRGTPLGDMYQTSGAAKKVLAYDDVWIRHVPNMPSNRAWANMDDNSVYGIFHEVNIESERKALQKTTNVITNAEIDFGFEEPEASIVAEFVTP